MMKRWILALIVGAAVVFVMLPGVVFADVWVGGTQLTEDGQTVQGNTGTATLSYDNGNPVLTLDNFTFTGTSYSWEIEGGTEMADESYSSTIYYNDKNKQLRILLKGQNSVSGNAIDAASNGLYSVYGIYSENGLIISSENNDNGNSLTAIANGGTVESKGICSNGVIVIESGSITARGINSGLEANWVAINGGIVKASGGTGLHSYGDVTINGGKVEAKGENTNGWSSRGILALGHVEITGGDVIAAGGDVTQCNYDASVGIGCTKYIKINGGKLEASSGSIQGNGGTSAGISANDSGDGIIFDWDPAQNSYPEIKSNCYKGKVTLNKNFWNDTDEISLPSGELLDSSSINGKTLVPDMEHKHDGITFTRWTTTEAAKQNGPGYTATNSLPSQEGKYYLTKNVDLGTSSWEVPAGTTSLCLNKCSITSAEDDDGAIVLNKSNCVLNLYDGHDTNSVGKITGIEENGVLLKEESTEFNMYGGEISGCDDYGAALNSEKASFHMYEGKISGCGYSGVGICNGADFILHNGEISNNPTYGVDARGDCIIENGTIKNNSTGVRISDTDFTIQNGVITGNKDGVIYDSGSFTVSGTNASPQISGNKKDGKANNLHIKGDGTNPRKISVAPGTKVGENASIGVSMESPATGVFTDGLSAALPEGKTAADIFSSDDSNYYVGTSAGEAQLVKNEQAAEVDPRGNLELVKGKEGSLDVAGWAFDPSDTSQPIDIHVYIGGEAGSAEAGNPVIIKANMERTDVDGVHHCGVYHGFGQNIQTGKRGEQKVYVYAINIGDGKNTFLGSQTVTITNPSIPPEKEPDSKDQLGDDGTAVGPGASEAAADKAITKIKNEKDPIGSKYGILQLKSTTQTKKSIKLKWKRIAKAKKYVIYGTACGPNKKPKKITTIKATSTSYKAKKADGKKMKKGTYYKFIVVALDKNNKVISTSKMAHAVTQGGKYGNHKSITTAAKKNKVTLGKGKTFRLKAKAIPKSKKLVVKIHRSTAYESSNPQIASVSSKGVIKGMKKGTCYVYAFAQNGINKTIKVTVK